MKDMNLYIIDTPYGYMVAPKNLKFFGMTNNKEHQATIYYEMHTMSSKIAHALYKDKETGECMSNMFIADAVNNNCQLVEWNGDLLPIPCFLEKKDANSFKKILEARQVLCLMDE